jgi:hypothetical protein
LIALSRAPDPHVAGLDRLRVAARQCEARDAGIGLEKQPLARAERLICAEGGAKNAKHGREIGLRENIDIHGGSSLHTGC